MLLSESLANCVVVSEEADLAAVRPAWTELLARCTRNELTQSPEWLLTWWRCYGSSQGRQLRVGLFREANHLIGLAPLLRRRHWYAGWLPFRRLEFLASGEPDEHGIYSNHLGVLAQRGAEEWVAFQLASAIRNGSFGSWDEVVLPMMSGDTIMPELLAQAFRAVGLTVDVTVTASARYISLPSTWDNYLRSLTPNGRRNIQRSLKAFDQWAEGSAQLHSVTDNGNLSQGKQILLHLHHQRWANDQQPGVFRSPFHVCFHDEMMRELIQKEALELLWLNVRGEPVAVLYGMVWAGKVYAYQTGRRMDLPSHLRPGAVLLALAIRRAIECGHREFDLLAEDALYKQQLAPHTRPLLQIRVTRSNLVEKIRRFARRCLATSRIWRPLSFFSLRT